jgi:type II secretory pathway pseudopilin PulG
VTGSAGSAGTAASAPGSRAEAGFSLVALAASCTIMLILMAAAVPSWQYVMKDMREEELIFRGCQIKDAIERYQKKNANTTPPSLDVLVKGKFLRKAYKDPMTKDGKWRMVHQGEAIAAGGGNLGGRPSPNPNQSPNPSPSPRSSPSPGSTTSGTQSEGSAGPAGGGLGAIVGVASTKKDKSLRVFNGRSRYDEWLFVAGQQCIVGLHPGMSPTGPSGPGQNPSPSPSVAK